MAKIEVSPISGSTILTRNSAERNLTFKTTAYIHGGIILEIEISDFCEFEVDEKKNRIIVKMKG